MVVSSSSSSSSGGGGGGGGSALNTKNRAAVWLVVEGEGGVGASYSLLLSLSSSVFSSSKVSSVKTVRKDEEKWRQL